MTRYIQLKKILNTFIEILCWFFKKLTKIGFLVKKMLFFDKNSDFWLIFDHFWPIFRKIPKLPKIAKNCNKYRTKPSNLMKYVEKIKFRHNFYGIFGRGKKGSESPKIWPAYLFFWTFTHALHEFYVNMLSVLYINLFLIKLTCVKQ